MISSIECSDFRKEYHDDFESLRKVRNESCQHYEITMKLFAKNGKFEKYKVTFSCKKCGKDDDNVFTENAKRIEYQCIKCKNSIIFSYINTLEDKVTAEEINRINNEDIEEEYNKYKINNFEILSDKNVGGRNSNQNDNNDNNSDNMNKYNNNNNRNNNSNTYNNINNNQHNFLTSSYNNNNYNNRSNLRIFKTPLNYDINNNNNHNNQSNSMANQTKYNYGIPASPSFNNINNDSSNRKTFTFVYKNKLAKIKLNPLLSLDVQYDIIQKELNFTTKKKILFNSEEIELKKPLIEIKDSERIEFEIDED